MSRGWKIALVVSAVLNLFLIGAVAGGLIVGARVLDERVELRRGGQSQRLAAAFQALPPGRGELRERIRDQALSAAPDLREAADARREAIRLIALPQYDAAAVAAALARARDAETRARARLDNTLATRVAELTPQERATFAGVLLRAPANVSPGRDALPEQTNTPSQSKVR